MILKVAGILGGGALLASVVNKRVRSIYATMEGIKGSAE